MNLVRSLAGCLLILLTFAPAAGAQTPTWTSLGPAGGEFGRVFVAPSQPTTLYAFPGSDHGGLFKSTNSGASWQSISGGMAAGSCDIHVEGLAIHPTKPDEIYAATTSLGVCKSTDGGVTWTQSFSGLPNDANSYQQEVRSIAINPATPTLLFAGTPVGVYMSVNSGNTWTFSGIANQQVEAIAFAPTSANTAYASVRNGFFKTTDLGATWVSAATGLPSTVAAGSVTVDPTNPNNVFLVGDNVYKSSNGGGLWAVSNTGVGNAFFLGNVSIVPTNPSVMFLTAPGGCGLCKSTNNGQTWAAFGGTGLPTAFGAANVAETTTIDPATPSRMFAGTPNGAFRSTDGGATWSSISTGLNGQLIGAMALSGDTPASLFIADSSINDGADIFKLTGGSLPFTAVVSPLPGTNSGKLSDLVVDPTNSSIIYAVGGKSSGQNCGQIYKSTNGGTSWTAINPSTVPSSLCAGPLVIDSTTPATLYLGVSSQTGGTQSAVVYKTTNGGTSWTSVSTGLSFSVGRLAISKRTPAVLYAASGSQAYKTTNGGTSWTVVSSGLSGSSGGATGRIAIDPTDDNTVYLATNSGIYGTTNGGTSWTAKRGGWPTVHGTFFGANAIAVDPVTPTTLYAGTAAPNPGPVGFLGQSALGVGLYKSTDSGANWTSATTTLGGVQVLDLLFGSAGAIFASTNNGVFKFGVPSANPSFTLERTALTFTAVGSGSAFSSQTPAQTVRLRQSGTGTATWTATSNKGWLTVTPASGSGAALLTLAVKADASAPASGAATGTIAITLTGASNTVGPINVTLNIVSSTAAASPAFGVIDTPAGDATVLAGSIAVTGWTLDNVGVVRVELWRDLQTGETTPPNPGGPGDPRTGKVFIANATFVDGARPDVEALNPTAPFNYRAGWGYLMLTWGLNNQGNGTYKLYAYAFDQEGNFSTIGSKTIVVSNNTATKPFGSIDTPTIGGDASGPNFGWGLTPKVAAAATCKIQASGVQYSIDSGPLQPVVYDDARSDIAGAFPGFSNTAAAGGHAIVDWTTLTNGPHTIGWLITDDCNRADGVGSRFFNVTTGTALMAADEAVEAAGTAGLPASLRAAETESDQPITVARGYGELPAIVDPATAGSRTVEMKQSERIEIRLPRGFDSAYQLGPSGQRRALPIGSTWDEGSGTFYWQPAAGFLGRFRIVFTNGSERLSVRVVVMP